jgi:hypothetical protein
MFEGLSDFDVVEYMGEATRYESMSVAERLASVAELFVRNTAEFPEREYLCVDSCVAVAAEVSAVQNISHARAVWQVQLACALRFRLPAVFKVFLRGTIDFRLVSMVANRTDNVDDERMSLLDEAIARHVEKWMKLSKDKLRDRVDQWVAKYDPAGVRIPPAVDENRYVEIDPASAGMAWLSGHLHATDGAALQQRLDALAATVCEHDPRTKQQRRADACGALARGEATLACTCGRDDCAAASRRDAAASAASAVIYLLAEQATLDGSSDNPGYLRGFGILPAQSVRDLAVSATLVPLPVPSGVEPDPGYRPSAATKQFVQWRDLTCRAPGCDRPVEKSDVDHTVPYPCGPTHPSNNKHYCRIHHLLKTFGGWLDAQLPDGTIVVKSPSGHIYSTEPHGAALFPALGQSTGDLDIPPAFDESGTDRSVMMPRRKQTRAQDRRDRINAERRQRSDMIAEQQRQRHAWLNTKHDPPPQPPPF